MRKTDFQSVDEYIAAQPEAVRTALERVRSAIRKAAPEIEETILYQMPTYRLQGKRVLHFAAWKDHYAIYAATGDLVAALKDELAPYDVDKGTIRFPFSQPVPVSSIGRIAKFRADQVAAKLTSVRRRSVRKPAARARRPDGDTPQAGRDGE